jgi:hypothetical protein
VTSRSSIAVAPVPADRFGEATPVLPVLPPGLGGDRVGDVGTTRPA